MATDQNNSNKEKLEDENLSFDRDKQSFELDVNDQVEGYDHPSDYETVATGAVDDDSTYDDSNPYVGDEYAENEDLIKDELLESGMRIDDAENLRPKAEDEFLARTSEDDRDDLDEEGYPVNDSPDR